MTSAVAAGCSRWVTDLYIDHVPSGPQPPPPSYDEIAELTARLGKNAKNSSKPPSTDGLAKPAPKSRREKTGRMPGGQPGHPGSTPALVDDPDRTVVHEPERCRRCGEGLVPAPVTAVERRCHVVLFEPASARDRRSGLHSLR